MHGVNFQNLDNGPRHEWGRLVDISRHWSRFFYRYLFRRCLPNPKSGIKICYLRIVTYGQEASCFLQMTLHKSGMPFLEHALAFHKGLEDMLWPPLQTSEQEMVSLCQSTRKKCVTRCVRFLELHNHGYWAANSGIANDWSGEHTISPSMLVQTIVCQPPTSEKMTIDDPDRENESIQPNLEPDNPSPNSDSECEITDTEALDLESRTTVEFIHRTTVDFPKDLELGKDFLEANWSLDFDP